MEGAVSEFPDFCLFLVLCSEPSTRKATASIGFDLEERLDELFSKDRDRELDLSRLLVREV